MFFGDSKESFTELTDSTESVITPEDLTNIVEANLSTPWFKLENCRRRHTVLLGKFSK